MSDSLCNSCDNTCKSLRQVISCPNHSNQTKLINLYTHVHAFDWMIWNSVRDSFNDKSITLNSIVTEWWPKAFGDSVIIQGGNYYEIICAIRIGLLYQAHLKTGYRINLMIERLYNEASSISFTKEPELIKSVLSQPEIKLLLQNTFFNPNEEAVMSVKKNTPAPKKTVPAKTSKKSVTPKKVVTKTAKPVAEKTEKKVGIKPTPNSFCRDLLLQRAFTDDEIVEKVLAIFPDKKFSKAYVSTTRTDLNKGYYKTVEVGEPLVKLHRVDDKILTDEEFKAKKEADEKALKAAKAAKKATPAPAKAPAPAPAKAPASTKAPVKAPAPAKAPASTKAPVKAPAPAKAPAKVPASA